MRTLTEIVSEYRKHNDRYLSPDEAKLIYTRHIIGYYNGLEVFVMGLDKNPQVHIWDSETCGKEFYTILSLTELKYNSETEFTEEQLKDFIKFLETEDDTFYDFHFTHWEYILKAWNIENRENKLDKNLTIPHDIY